MRVEKRTVPIGGCLLDLMATILDEEYQKDSRNAIAFSLSPMALISLLNYKGHKLVDFSDKNGAKKLEITWFPSKDSMSLRTNRFRAYGCADFYTVISCGTKKLAYSSPENVDVLYLIKGSI